MPRQVRVSDVTAPRRLTSLADLYHWPILLAGILGLTLLVVGVSRWLRHWLTNRQCVALIHQLEEPVRMLSSGD